MKSIKICTIISISLICTLLCSCGREKCCDNTDKKIVGAGDLVSKTLILGNFNHFSLVGQGNVTITKGDTQKVILRAQQNILNVLTSQVDNGTLILSNDSYNIQTSKGIYLDIITPTPITEVNIIGAGDINISGNKQNSLNINISGAGNVNAYNLVVDDCEINLSGTGNCKVFVNNNLNIMLSGVGDVKYKGHPKLIQSISGIGSVIEDN